MAISVRNDALFIFRQVLAKKIRFKKSRTNKTVFYEDQDEIPGYKQWVRILVLFIKKRIS